MTARVAVVGAGIAGLAAAYALRSSGLDVVVLDGADRIGGKLLVSEVGGIPVDAGAEAMLARAPAGTALAAQVGADVVHPLATSAGIWADGGWHPLPGRTVLGVPADIASVRASGLVSDADAERIAAEPGLDGPVLRDDAPVATVIGARLGGGIVDRLVEPLLGGIYAGRSELLSLRATMPAIAARLAERPSVVAAARSALATAPSASGPVFGTLIAGLGALPALVAAASGAQIRTGTTVRAVERTSSGFRLIAGPVPHPEAIDVEGVIVAAPATKAALMLRAAAPAVARELAGIDYASTALLTFAFAGDPGLPAGRSGVLVPPSARLAVKAFTFSSAKWAHLAGPVTIVRASLGRFGDEVVLQRDDGELVGLARTDLATVAGVRSEPVDVRVSRWGGALPQYNVGHLERVGRIEAAVGGVPGLEVCGAAYHGVGVPACITDGQAAAGRILAHLAEQNGSHG
ncbi:MAG: protoporphyrinogen oxidase [Mycobacteriales bacterium]